MLEQMIEYARNAQDLLVISEHVKAPTRVLIFVPLCVAIEID